MKDEKWINGPKCYYKNKTRINAGSITTFSNYSIISENRVFIKPKKMNDEEAAFYGCAVLTGGGIIMLMYHDIGSSRT